MSNAVRRRGIIDLRKRRPGIRTGSTANTPRHERESLRTRRRKLRALLALFCLFVIGAAIYGLGRLSYSPKLLINNVSVAGTKDVSPKLIRAYVETGLKDGTNPILSRENIFLYPKKLIESSIEKYFSRVKEANISRAGLLAQAITVTVEERQPFALWCREAPDSAGAQEQECYLMDDTGFIYADALPFSDKVYMVFGGGLLAQAELVQNSSPIGETFLPKNLGGVLELIKRLRQAGFAPKRAIAENEKDFSVQFDEGFTAYMLFNEDANTLVRNLQLALSSEFLRGKVDKLEYVDLRFGNRVYYKNRQ